MMGDISKAEAIYLACGYTDMRKNIDGLAMHVQQVFDLDPFTNTLFLFCGRDCRRIKALYWEGDGFVLLYKRVENGRFRWPRSTSEAKKLRPKQLEWLLDGLEIEPKKSIHPSEKRIVI